MTGDITQDNLYLILPSKVCRVADLLSDNMGLSPIEAVKRIYASDTYRRLSVEETKMWHLGPADLYRDLRREMGE